MTDHPTPDAQRPGETSTTTALTPDAFVAAAEAAHVTATRAARSARPGVSALVAGGTARERRTVAERAADAAGATLIRVDIAAVIGKYIGETEKNIDLLFERARSSGFVLFFDEADALFGKRTGVKDSHDRYANIEVSYLLQKIEAHPGIAVLSSNLKSNIDPAFIRRLRYLVELP